MQDPEAEALCACVNALASFDVVKDHQTIVRIFEYLHQRFYDKAVERKRQLLAEIKTEQMTLTVLGAIRSRVERAGDALSSVPIGAFAQAVTDAAKGEPDALEKIMALGNPNP